MNKPVAFIVVEGGQTWLRTTAETEEAIRTGFITETTPLYKQREPLTDKEISHGFRSDEDATNAESYWAGVEYAEKHHGITGGSNE